MPDNPFGIMQIDVPGMLQTYTGMQRQRLQDMYTRAAFERQQKLDQRGDEEYARAERARSLIAAGAKPEEVIAADPATGFSYATHAAQISKAQREEAAKRADDVGSAAVYLNSLPDKELAAQWDSVIDKLVAEGHADLAAYKGKPDRAALGPIISASDQAVKAYVAHLEHDNDATARDAHNKFMEGIAARNSAISAGNLDLSRQREQRIKKWGPQPLIGVMSNVPSGTDDLNY